MNAKQYDLIVEAFSRRKFLKTGSAVLAENPDSNMPPPTDHGDMVPLWYSFDLVKKRVEEGGWTHEVTEVELPSSKDIAGVNVRLTAGNRSSAPWLR